MAATEPSHNEGIAPVNTASIRNPKRLYAFTAATVLTLCAWSGVHAQDNQSDSATERQLSLSEPDGWWFEVQPYLWLSAVGAEVDAGPLEAEVDAEFKDLLEVLDKAIMLHAEAHHGPWGIFADVMWTRLDKDENIGATGEIDVKLDQAFIELGGFYRFTKQFNERKLTFDPLLGTRIGIVGTDVDISDGGGTTVSADRTESWAEPLIGGRVQFHFGPKFSTGLRADVSGFGVGSELTWNINAETRYRINEWFSMTFGYRYMNIDFETENDVEIESTMNGPVLGFLFTF